jgi:hypothetical protein
MYDLGRQVRLMVKLYDKAWSVKEWYTLSCWFKVRCKI